jgi:hypothetical protein
MGRKPISQDDLVNIINSALKSSDLLDSLLNRYVDHVKE